MPIVLSESAFADSDNTIGIQSAQADFAFPLPADLPAGYNCIADTHHPGFQDNRSEAAPTGEDMG